MKIKTKHRKLFYVPGMISLVLIPVLCLWFIKTNRYLTQYKSVSFNISDSVYGSIFFMATGFHGFHVLVGTLFLFVCLIRLLKGHFSIKHHLGLEFAI